MRAESAKNLVMSFGLVSLVAVGCVQNRQSRSESAPFPSEQTARFFKSPYVTSNTGRHAVFDDPSQWPSRPPEEVVQSRFAQMFPNLSRRVNRSRPASPISAELARVDVQAPNVADATTFGTVANSPDTPQVETPSHDTNETPAKPSDSVTELAALAHRSSGMAAVTAAIASVTPDTAPLPTSPVIEKSESPVAEAKTEPQQATENHVAAAEPKPEPQPSADPSFSSPDVAVVEPAVRAADAAPVAPLSRPAITAPDNPVVAASPPVDAPPAAEASEVLAQQKHVTEPAVPSFDKLPAVPDLPAIPAIESVEPKSVRTETPGIAVVQPNASPAASEVAAGPTQPVVVSESNESVPVIPGLSAADPQQVTSVASEPAVGASDATKNVADSLEDSKDSRVAETAPTLTIPGVPAEPAEATERPQFRVAQNEPAVLPSPANQVQQVITETKQTATLDQPNPPMSMEPGDLKIPGLSTDSTQVSSGEAVAPVIAGDPSSNPKPVEVLPSPDAAKPVSDAQAASELPLAAPPQASQTVEPEPAALPGALTEPPPPGPAPEIQIPGISDSAATETISVPQATEAFGSSPTDAGVERSSSLGDQSTSVNEPQTEVVAPESADGPPEAPADMPQATPEPSPEIDDEVPVLQPLPDDDLTSVDPGRRSFVERRPGELVITLKLSNPLRRGLFRSLPDDVPSAGSRLDTLKNAAKGLFVWQRKSDPAEESTEPLAPADSQVEPASSLATVPSVVPTETAAVRTAEVADQATHEMTVATAQPEAVVESESQPEQEKLAPVVSAVAPTLERAVAPNVESRTEVGNIPPVAAQVRGGLPPVQFPASYYAKRPKSANPWYAHSKPAVDLVADPRTPRVATPAMPQQAHRTVSEPARKDASFVPTSLTMPVPTQVVEPVRKRPNESDFDKGPRWWSRAGKSLLTIWGDDDEIVPPKRPGWATRQSMSK